MRWAGHVALWGRGKTHTGFRWGNLTERVLLEDPSLDEKIILRWISRKWEKGACTGSSWLRIGTGSGHV